jgi:hypothetical protein
MKNTLTKSLLLALALMLPAGAYADSHTSKTYQDRNGDRYTVDSGGTLRMKAGSTADLSGPTFSTALTGNPLVQDNYTDTTVSTGLTSASMTTIIASSAGRTIYPGAGLSIMVSGTAATATSLALECSDGTLIANWPIAVLTDLNPVGAFASTVVTRGAGLGRGCAASTALMLSNVGTNITTTTHVYTNVPYTVQ